MRLAEKIRYLREVEGSLRSLGRPMTQQALVRSDLRTTEGKLDVWLLQGSERFASDPEVSEVLLKAAREKDTRRCFLLLGAILDTPGLAERLLEALKPDLRKPATSRSHRRTEERRRSK